MVQIGDAMNCLDYGRSYIRNAADFNNVRFWVESRTSILDEETGAIEVFYQCGSCKSENTFAKRDLFKEDNYDFLPILGGKDWLVFRRPCGLSDHYREIKTELWGDPIPMLRYAENVVELADFAAIRDATAKGLPLVAQTEIQNEQTSLRAIIEYPVKTMNIRQEDSMYQVDTGPVAFPDLTQRVDKLLSTLSLAFVAFNAHHFADFVVEQPTPVVVDGQELTQVYHYSKPFSLAARNRLYAHVD